VADPAQLTLDVRVALGTVDLGEPVDRFEQLALGLEGLGFGRHRNTLDDGRVGLAVLA
jgi:hypothetical protein